MSSLGAVSVLSLSLMKSNMSSSGTSTVSLDVSHADNVSDSEDVSLSWLLFSGVSACVGIPVDVNHARIYISF